MRDLSASNNQNAETRRNLVGVLFVCELVIGAICVVCTAVAIAIVSEIWCGWLFVALAALVVWAICHRTIRQIVKDTTDDEPA